MALIAEGLRSAPAVRVAADSVKDRAWVVGGAVRDAALGRPVIDADLAVEPGHEEPAARSSSMPPPRSGDTSTCQLPSRAAARQVSKRDESSNAWPSPARAIAFAASRGSPATARSRSVTRRSSAASRTAPPTIQASEPASACERTAVAGTASRRSVIALKPPPAAPGPRSRT